MLLNLSHALLSCSKITDLSSARLPTTLSILVQLPSILERNRTKLTGLGEGRSREQQEGCVCSPLPVWNAACSFEDATVIWQPISTWFLGGFLPGSHRASLTRSVPHPTIPMKCRGLNLSMPFSPHFEMTSCSVTQCCCCPGQIRSRFHGPS